MPMFPKPGNRAPMASTPPFPTPIRAERCAAPWKPGSPLQKIQGSIRLVRAV